MQPRGAWSTKVVDRFLTRQPQSIHLIDILHSQSRPHDKSAPGGSQSEVSVASAATAPARYISGGCFLPRTSFKRPSGGRITAAEFRKSGGDVVLGLDGKEVRVCRSIRRQPKMDWDVIKVFLNGATYPFQATADHRIVVDELGNVVKARTLLTHSSGPRHIFNGLSWRVVERAEIERMTTEVVEVTFEDDATVLAWVLPRNASVQLDDAAGVACRGKRLTLADTSLVENFWGHFPGAGMGVASEPYQGSRSRSACGRLESVP